MFKTQTDPVGPRTHKSGRRRARQGYVLHIVPALFGTADGVLGGAERYAFELARTMGRFVPTVLLSFGRRSRTWREGDLRVIVERAAYVRGQRTNPWSPAILRWLAGAAVVHCHQRTVLATSTAAVVGWLLGRPIFVTDLGGGGWDISGYVSLTSWYTATLHISEYSRTLSNEAERRNAFVIGGGVDTEKFSPAPGETKDGSVLYVGRILPHKGVNYLVEATDERTRVRIVGMPYDERFLADLHALAVGKRIEFITSGIGDDALIAEYRKALVAVLPSVYRNVYGGETRVPELLGQTALEAMACGTPVVCTAVASLPEVVVDGETGFLVPPNDARALGNRIRWLLDHPGEAAAMGAAARRRAVEKFSWRAATSRCLEHYSAHGGLLSAIVSRVRNDGGDSDT